MTTQSEITLSVERDEIKRSVRLGWPSKLDAARMALARKGVVNHWTLTFRDGPEGFAIFRNPVQPGVAPLP